MTSFFHAEHPPPVQPSSISSTRLAVYNSKSSKPNGLASPLRQRRKNLAMFKKFFQKLHLASSMAQSSARRSPCQNPHDGKEKLAGGTATKRRNRRTPALATSRTPTPAVAPVIAPLAASSSANSFVVEYSEHDLQRIFRTVLNSRPLAPVPAPIIAATLHYKGPRERSLKAWFPDIDRGKTHLECYNFFQQCKDHFATANATGSNRVPFAATFLKNTALFRWQQHQRKVEDQTNVPIS